MYSIKVEAEDSPIWEEKRSETTITSRIKQENFVEETGDNIVPRTDAASSHLIAEGSESGTNKEETSGPSHEKGVDGVTWQVNVHLECDEDMVEITENVTDAIVEKDSEDEGSCVNLRSRKEEFSKPADWVMCEASAPQTTKSGDRQINKRKMLQCQSSDSTTNHQETRTNALKKVLAEKTDKAEFSAAKEGKVQDAMEIEKAQQTVCQQVVPSKGPSFDASAVMIATAECGTDNINREFDADFSKEDEHHNPANPVALTTEPSMKVEIATLKERVKDLEAKLQMALDRISELETTRQRTPVPDLSVVTPKKLQLVKDVYHIVESAAGLAPSGATRVRKKLHQQTTLKTNPGLALERTTPPSHSTREKIVGKPTKPSEALTPLFPGGKPILSEKSKRIAFGKGKCKESLLYALLTEVFGNDVLARSNALGARQAVNKIGTEEHQPLDQDKLHEIKECVLQRYPLKSGLPCMTSKEFNMKINQKCGTGRRALKRKLDN